MKDTNKEYLDFYFEEITSLDAKNKVYKAKFKDSGEFVIVKIINRLVGNVYHLLKKNYSPLFPEILYCAEDKANTDTVVVYRFFDGGNFLL